MIYLKATLIGIAVFVGMLLFFAIPILANDLFPPPPNADRGATGLLIIIAETVAVSCAIFWLSDHKDD